MIVQYFVVIRGGLWHTRARLFAKEHFYAREREVLRGWTKGQHPGHKCAGGEQTDCMPPLNYERRHVSCYDGFYFETAGSRGFFSNSRLIEGVMHF